MTLEPQVCKYLKLKVHHLSHYMIVLYENIIVITFVMENFADTSDNKRSKVITTCELTIDKTRKIYKNCLHIKGKETTHTVENCTPEWFDELYKNMDNNVEQILCYNKKLEVLKQIKKEIKKPLNYEQKQMYKREKKTLEAQKSIYKDRLKKILKELFETD